MAEKSLFWIKPRSVLKIDGKLFDGSKPLPIDKLDEKFLKENIKLGYIGEKISPAKIESLSASEKKELENLRAENKKLKEKKKEKKTKKSGPKIKEGDK